jgi:hypothetical protein
MLLYLQETELNQFDKWYSWCGLQHTFDLIPYYEQNLLNILYNYAFYYWFYIKWINHHAAIITTIPSTHHRSMNSTVYANSTSMLDMVLMVDTDKIWLNKQGNYVIIFGDFDIIMRSFLWFAWRRIYERGLELGSIYWTWSWSVG